MIAMRSMRRGHRPPRDPNRRGGVRRAVVMVPNGFTLFNLFCGVYAIILAFRGNLNAAPGFIVLGGIADALDGRVARATGTGSRFGEELDSLVDAISFGLAPALIVYLGMPNPGNLDWLLVFIYTACAVMRLARFNVEQAGHKKTHFHGLPSPAAGLTLATYYWFSQTPLYNETVILFTDSTTLAQLPWHNLLRGIMAILAALMISDVPYPAMPSVGYNSIKRVLGTLLVLGAVALLLFRRQEFLFPALLAYVLYGLVKWIIIGFLGRSSTPDQIFWEREAELHQEDEARSVYDRPDIGKEALEDVADDEERPRSPRDNRDSRDGRDSRNERRDGRERREGREARPDRAGREERKEERRAKRREEARRERDESRREGNRDSNRDSSRDSNREGGRRDEARRAEAPKREEKREDKRTDVAIENAPVVAAPESDVTTPDSIALESADASPTRDEARRKRRRRRGRGGRGRGERNAGPGGSDAVGGESGDDDSADAGDSGDSGDVGESDAFSDESFSANRNDEQRNDRDRERETYEPRTEPRRESPPSDFSAPPPSPAPPEPSAPPPPPPSTSSDPTNE